MSTNTRLTTTTHGENQADACRRLGWLPGTRLAGDEGYGVTVIEITALGESQVLAKRISHKGIPCADTRETSWTLSCRDWKVVPDTVRVCIDEDCPGCGWAERWADVEMTSEGPTPIRFGCNKCDYRSQVRDA